MDSWDVIGARLPNLFEVCGLDLHLGIIDDSPYLFILNNRPLGLCIRHFFARRLEAVTTLIRKEVPCDLFSVGLR